MFARKLRRMPEYQNFYFRNYAIVFSRHDNVLQLIHSKLVAHDKDGWGLT